MSPIPVHLLTCFLGSGKTTLLNAILREPALGDTAVLVNEMGEVAIDHDLIAAVEDGMVFTTTGCLCCTAQSDVLEGLAELLTRGALGRVRPFARVIVETTGLADPAPVVASLTAGLEARWPITPEQPEPPVRLASVTSLYDVVMGEAALDEHFEALKQVALADRLVLTKTDLAKDPASRADIECARARLLAINPGAAILDRHADWPAIVSGFRSASAYDLSDRSADALAWLQAEAVAAHRHATAAPDGTLPDRHGDGIAAHVLTVDEPLDPRGFYLFLEMLRLSAGAKILRMKGLFALADDPERPLVVHGVQHMIHPVAKLDRWPSEDRRTRLVLIGRDLKAHAIARMLSTLKPRAPRDLSAGTPAG